MVECKNLEEVFAKVKSNYVNKSSGSNNTNNYYYSTITTTAISEPETKTQIRECAKNTLRGGVCGFARPSGEHPYPLPHFFSNPSPPHFFQKKLTLPPFFPKKI